MTDLPETLSDQELADYVQDFSSTIAELSRQRTDLAARQESLSKDLEQFEHFRGLDIELEDILSCKTIKVRFGRLPKESFEKLKAYNDNPYVLFFPGVTDAEYYWGVYFARWRRPPRSTGSSRASILNGCVSLPRSAPPMRSSKT